MFTRRANTAPQLNLAKPLLIGGLGCVGDDGGRRKSEDAGADRMHAGGWRKRLAELPPEAEIALEVYESGDPITKFVDKSKTRAKSDDYSALVASVYYSLQDKPGIGGISS